MIEPNCSAIRPFFRYSFGTMIYAKENHHEGS
jgi:hypothetical protein